MIQEIITPVMTLPLVRGLPYLVGEGVRECEFRKKLVHNLTDVAGGIEELEEIVGTFKENKKKEERIQDILKKNRWTLIDNSPNKNELSFLSRIANTAEKFKITFFNQTLHNIATKGGAPLFQGCFLVFDLLRLHELPNQSDEIKLYQTVATTLSAISVVASILECCRLLPFGVVSGLAGFGSGIVYSFIDVKETQEKLDRQETSLTDYRLSKSQLMGAFISALIFLPVRSHYYTTQTSFSIQAIGLGVTFYVLGIGVIRSFQTEALAACTE